MIVNKTNEVKCKIAFEIEGMTCSNCSFTVQRCLEALNHQEGLPRQLAPLRVEAVSVVLPTNTGSAIVHAIFDPALTWKDIVEILSHIVVDAVEGCGFGCAVTGVVDLQQNVQPPKKKSPKAPDSTELTTTSELVYTLGIHGMTCSSCSGTIESHLKSFLGEKASVVQVNLTTNAALIRHTNEEPLNERYKDILFETFKDEIEAIGFECEMLGVKVEKQMASHSTSKERQSSLNATSPPQSIKTFLVAIDSVGDFHRSTPSANDVGRLEAHLKAPHVINPENENTGRQRLSSPPSSLQGGVTDVSVYKPLIGTTTTPTSATAPLLRVSLDVAVLGPRHLRALVRRDLGYDISLTALGGGMMTAQRLHAQQSAETARHWHDVLVSMTFTVPILIITMGLSHSASPLVKSWLFGPTVLGAGFNLNCILLFFLSSPVQWYVGMRFHRKALLSFRSGNLGMDFLISTGTSAAYLYSFIGLIRGFLAGQPRNHDVEYFETAAVLVSVVVLGKFLETFAKGKTASAIHKLTTLRAKTARLVVDPSVVQAAIDVVREDIALGETSEARHGDNRDIRSSSNTFDSTSDVEDNVDDELIDAVYIHEYDVLRLVTGESVPADGLLAMGYVGVDESMLTGESRVVSKGSGDKVYAGTTVVEGSAVVYVTACGDDSTLGKIVATVQDAQSAKPPIQEIADRVAQYFVPAVAVISLLTFLTWMSAWAAGAVPADWYTPSHSHSSTSLSTEEMDEVDGGGSPVLFSFLFALAVWVSACPCAFGLATPCAILVATGVAAQHGILVRKGAAIQHAAEVDTVAFDKTGTLTMGRAAVTDCFLVERNKSNVSAVKNSSAVIKVMPEDGFYAAHSTAGLLSVVDAYVVYQLTMLAEAQSGHPLARGILNFCRSQINRITTESSVETVFRLRAIDEVLFSASTAAQCSVDLVPGQGLAMSVPVDAQQLPRLPTDIFQSSSILTSLLDSHNNNNATSSDCTLGKDLVLTVCVGSESLMARNGCRIIDTISASSSPAIGGLVNSLRAVGKVAVFVGIGVNGSHLNLSDESKSFQLAVIFGISDVIRPEAYAVVSELHRRGILCYMVTGDAQRTACAIGDAVGIPPQFILAGAKPHDKETFIATLQKLGRKVLFVGDGTNDSPALARAHVGIAMAGGTDVAIEAGDVVLCKHTLESLPAAISIAQTTLRRIKLNYFWAIAYNAVLIPLAAGVLYPAYRFTLAPKMAGSAMALSSISIVVSSLALGFYRPPPLLLGEEDEGNGGGPFGAFDGTEDEESGMQRQTVLAQHRQTVWERITSLFARQQQQRRPLVFGRGDEYLSVVASSDHYDMNNAIELGISRNGSDNRVAVDSAGNLNGLDREQSEIESTLSVRNVLLHMSLGQE